MRPITKVDNTYALPCGCVAKDKPHAIVEWCSTAWLPWHWPVYPNPNNPDWIGRR